MIESIPSDANLQLITAQIFVGHSILIAYKIGLFKLLAKKPMNFLELRKELKLSDRSLQAIISSSASLNLIKKNDNLLTLDMLGKTYLDPKSDLYYGGVFDVLLQESEIMNYDIIEKAILTGKPQVDNCQNLFNDKNNLGNSKAFILALHQKSLAPAFAWTKLFNFKKIKTFVDLGAGSAVHSIAVCLKSQSTKAIACDRKPVLKHTKKFVADYSLEDKILLCELDLWKDKLPDGDVYFLADIFHDWPIERCLFLAKKCYDSLKSGGQIFLHEMLFNPTKSGPFLTSGYNMKMMLWTEGQQYSFLEIKKMLHQVGFRNVKYRKTFGNWSIITGVK